MTDHGPILCTGPMVSSLVQTKWLVPGGMMATLPGVSAWVLLVSKVSPMPVFSVPEIMVMCSVPGCLCGGTL